MKVLCVISARGGSKGVPGKNLKNLNGMPLIAHAFIKAKRAKNIDQVICSTDSSDIENLAKNYDVDVPFNRPPELAVDSTPLISVTQHAMLEMDRLEKPYDIIVQFSPTCPFIKIKNLEESVNNCLNSECDSAVSLQKIEHEHPYRARKIIENNYFENFIKDINVEDKKYHSRQDLPLLYCTSGGIYTRKRFLLEKFDGSDFAMGKKRKAIFLDDYESVNIDTMIDFEFAEFLVNNNKLDNEHLINK